MYRYPHQSMIISLILAYGNNADKVNEGLQTYQLPELTDNMMLSYSERAKKYPIWARDALKDLVSYYKDDKYMPALELLTALRIVSNVQLRCITNSQIILGNKLDGSPEPLSYKELEVYMFYFFDITGWTYLDWNDYMKEVALYERTILKYALDGKTRDVLMALQLIPDSTEDEMLMDTISKSYKHMMQLEGRLSNTVSLDEQKQILQLIKIRSDIICNSQKVRMARRMLPIDDQHGEEKDDKPLPIRLVYIDDNGNIVAEKTREELEKDMKRRLEADDERFKALAAEAAAGNTDTASGQAKS